MEEERQMLRESIQVPERSTMSQQFNALPEFKIPETPHYESSSSHSMGRLAGRILIPLTGLIIGLSVRQARKRKQEEKEGS